MGEFYFQVCLTCVILICAATAMLSGTAGIGLTIFYSVAVAFSVTIDYLTYKRCKRRLGQ